jgi:prepilin peptidase CpaA
LFAALLIVAALSDIATMTIPDWVSIVAVVAFPIAAFAAGLSWQQIALHLAIGVLMFLIGFGLFAANVLGGGDVKVFAAASVWSGLAALAPFTLVMAVSGGALAVIVLAARALAKPNDAQPAFVRRLLDPRRGVPYGVAIAIGALAALPQQPLAQMILR